MSAPRNPHPARVFLGNYTIKTLSWFPWPQREPSFPLDLVYHWKKLVSAKNSLTRAVSWGDAACRGSAQRAGVSGKLTGFRPVWGFSWPLKFTQNSCSASSRFRFRRTPVATEKTYLDLCQFEIVWLGTRGLAVLRRISTDYTAGLWECKDHRSVLKTHSASVIYANSKTDITERLLKPCYEKRHKENF